MPKPDSHLRQAQHNRDLISALDPATTIFLDWIVTVAFYTALHRIEAWFASKGLHFESHTQRDDWLTKVKGLRQDIWPRYKELEFQSRQARYQCVSFDRDFVQNHLLVLLDDIEREVQSLT
jgi:hypothetical protein